MFIDMLEKTLKEKNITMNKLAKGTGIPQGSTIRWKKGSSPGIDKLIKICQYLHVSADYLLELEPPDPPPDRLDRLEEKEKILIEYYRTADERGREYIFEAAEREAARAAPQEEISLNSKIG